MFIIYLKDCKETTVLTECQNSGFMFTKCPLGWCATFQACQFYCSAILDNMWCCVKHNASQWKSATGNRTVPRRPESEHIRGTQGFGIWRHFTCWYPISIFLECVLWFVCLFAEYSHTGKWCIDSEADLGWQRDCLWAGGGWWQVHLGKEVNFTFKKITMYNLCYVL